MLGLSKTAKILFFREPEVLETGMIMLYLTYWIMNVLIFLNHI